MRFLTCGEVIRLCGSDLSNETKRNETKRNETKKRKTNGLLVSTPIILMFVPSLSWEMVVLHLGKEDAQLKRKDEMNKVLNTFGMRTWERSACRSNQTACPG